jgi:hypothetical protein
MEASNNTNTDTQYRTAGGNPRMDEKDAGPSWKLIKAGETVTIPDPPCPFLLEFRVGGKIVYSQSCNRPLGRVLLSQAGDQFRVRRYQRTAKRPTKYQTQKPPQPTRSSSGPAGDGPRSAPRT